MTISRIVMWVLPLALGACARVEDELRPDAAVEDPVDAAPDAGDAQSWVDCQALADSIARLLQEHGACSADEDCTVVYSGGCLSERVSSGVTLPPEMCAYRGANVNIRDTALTDHVDRLARDCHSPEGRLCMVCDLGATAAYCDNGACLPTRTPD